MSFFGVARVLIVNQLKAYRVHKFLVISDLLVTLGVLPAIFIGKGFVIEFYETLTSYVSLESLKITLSSAISAIIFLSSARSRGRIIVFRDQYPIFLYPVSVSEFLLGRLLFEAFVLLRLSVPIFVFFYLLTYISGNISSAILAYVAFIIGLVYLSAISLSLKLIGMKSLLYLLTFVSVLDALTGKITASLLFYIVIDSVHSCYAHPNLTPIFLVFSASIALLLLLSSKANVDVEEFRVTFRFNVKSENVNGTLKKTLLELKRSKILYSILLIPPSFLAGIFVDRMISFEIPEFLAIYAALFVVSIMEYYAMQEVAALWLYRVTNSVEFFAKSVIAKTFLSGLLSISPLVTFSIPLLKSPYVAVLSLSFVAVLSTICSIVAIKMASKTKISLRFMGVAESRAAAETSSIILFVLTFFAALVFGILVFTLGYFAALLIATPLFGVRLVKKFAEEVDLR